MCWNSTEFQCKRNGWPGLAWHHLAGGQVVFGGAAGEGRGTDPEAKRTSPSEPRQWGRSPGPGGSLVGGAKLFSDAMPSFSECVRKAVWGAKPSAPEPDRGRARGLRKTTLQGGHDRCNAAGGGGSAVVTSSRRPVRSPAIRQRRHDRGLRRRRRG